MPRTLIRSIQKGITPSHAEPWKVSTCKPSGISGASTAAGTGQWAKSRSFQRCLISQRPDGKGRGLCDVRTRYSSMAGLLLFALYRLAPTCRSRFG